MWINVRIYGVEANSEAGNIRVYITTKQKGHSGKILSSKSRKLGILAESQRFPHSFSKFSFFTFCIQTNGLINWYFIYTYIYIYIFIFGKKDLNRKK